MAHFQQVGEQWQINADIRDMVRFEQGNLLADIGGLGRFDIVFCRNVLIYFDPPTKADVLRRIRACMANDGALFLGGAETVIGVSDAFKTIPGTRGVYATSAAPTAPPPLARTA